MQTVKIPEDTRPWFDCTINGRHYRYKAGTTVSVPDEVAALIADINASRPQQAVPVPTQQIRRPTAAGKTLQSNDALEWVEKEYAVDSAFSDTSDNPVKNKVVTVALMPKDLDGELSVGEDEKKSITYANITAAELYNIASQHNRMFISTIDIGVGALSIFVHALTAEKIQITGTDRNYGFSLTDEHGVVYAASGLAADAAVVLKEV